MRYEIKLQVSSDSDIEAIKKTLKGIEKSGKVEVHWIRSQVIGKVGRPPELEAKVLAYLEKHQYPRSVKQIGAAIEVAPTSLYRIMYGLKEEGKLDYVIDPRWNTKRFGDKEQCTRWDVRQAAREEKAKASPWYGTEKEPGF